MEEQNLPYKVDQMIAWDNIHTVSSKVPGADWVLKKDYLPFCLYF